MLYSAHELSYQMMTPARYAAGIGARFWRSPYNPLAESWLVRTSAAALDVFEHATRRYPKPGWGIFDTEVNGETVAVMPEIASTKPFADLLHFRRDHAQLEAAKKSKDADPKVLIIAPLSGHYATLLRGTVEAMVPSHDVYITDWRNARMAPLAAGRFDLNDFIDYLIRFLHDIGEPAHTMAVCQPGPALLSAASVMAKRNDPLRPLSMTIMGSPIDTRRSPTTPNILAQERPFEWFARNMIYSVPAPYPGVMRRVYPGFVQLYSFLSMNHDRHANAHYEYFSNLVKGDGDSTEKHRSFYDEYLSVLDMTEEFYLQTIKDVFQDHSLPDRKFNHHGELVDPSAIKDVALMTVEGENDDISGIGQTQAAHDLCTNLPSAMQLDYIQPGVGHYGVFNGSRWRNEIQPKVADFIRKHHSPEARAMRSAAE
ncbi:MAG: polyhydroxyalkanoate depolymerase [Pseudomonadota bacterium]